MDAERVRSYAGAQSGHSGSGSRHAHAIAQGQANHFFRYAPEKIEYGINRYQTETKRLYQVLEDRLLEQQSQAGPKGPWLVGDKMTIADLASFSWVNWDVWAGVDVKEFRLLHAWSDRINNRPAIQKGLDVPEPFEMKKKMQTKVSNFEIPTPRAFTY